MERTKNILLATACLVFACGATLAQSEMTVPKELLDRLAESAARFVESYQDLAAEEALVQTKYNRKGQPETERRIVSDFAVLRMGGEGRGELVELRDAVTVDGKEIMNAEQRQARWTRLAAAGTRAEAAALFREAPAHRLFREQFEGLALLVNRFAERHREKLKFQFAQERSESDDTGRHVILSYRQSSGEGLMSLDGKPAMPAGRAWADPDSGAIWRIEEWFDAEKDTRYWMAVDFARDDRLGGNVLIRIVIRVLAKGRLETQSEYSYSRIRRLERGTRASAP